MEGTQIATARTVQAVMSARYQRIASRRQRLRAPLVAIDRIIAGLEVGHLAGRTALDDHVCQELAHLSELVPLTDEITAAVDTRRLHSALLDLQEAVLETVMPSRRVLTQHDHD